MDDELDTILNGFVNAIAGGGNFTGQTHNLEDRLTLQKMENAQLRAENTALKSALQDTRSENTTIKITLQETRDQLNCALVEKKALTQKYEKLKIQFNLMKMKKQEHSLDNMSGMPQHQGMNPHGNMNMYHQQHMVAAGQVNFGFPPGPSAGIPGLNIPSSSDGEEPTKERAPKKPRKNARTVPAIDLHPLLQSLGSRYVTDSK